MQNALFKATMEKLEKAKKNKKKGGKDQAAVSKAQAVGKKDAPSKIKKNRVERRKDIRKAQRKQNRAKAKKERKQDEWK